MKLEDINVNEKNDIESVIKVKQEIEIKFDSDLKPKKGHTLFEIEVSSGKIKEAEYFQEDSIHWFDMIHQLKNGFRRKVLKKKGCVYISALNQESALKRLKDGKGSSGIKRTDRKIFYT